MRTKGMEFIGCEVQPWIKTRLNEYSHNKKISPSAGLRDILTTFFSLTTPYGSPMEQKKRDEDE